MPDLIDLQRLPYLTNKVVSTGLICIRVIDEGDIIYLNVLLKGLSIVHNEKCY